MQFDVFFVTANTCLLCVYIYGICNHENLLHLQNAIIMKINSGLTRLRHTSGWDWIVTPQTLI